MKKIISILLAAVMVMALLAGCGSKNKDNTNDNNTPNNNQTTELSGSVATNGSTSMDKVIGALREQFMTDHKNVTVTYDPTGSGSGIEAVKNGTADIGLASRSLKDEEKADGLTETVIALDGIAVIVHAQSKVTDLTVEQIAKIFTGEITDWSQVGGDPAPSPASAVSPAAVPVTASSPSPDQGFLQAGSGADLYRRRHRGRGRQPQRHRLCLPLRCGGQGHREGRHRRRCGLHRGRCAGRQLRHSAALRAGDQGRHDPVPGGTGLLRLRHLQGRRLPHSECGCRAYRQVKTNREALICCGG